VAGPADQAHLVELGDPVAHGRPDTVEVNASVEQFTARVD
jgi:hypothetical protein